MADFIEDYVESTKHLPSPENFRLWSAITAVSGVLERKTWTAAGARPIFPGLYTLLVGPPASGKTNAIVPVRDLWSQIDGLHMSPDNVTRASLVDALSKSIRTVINGSASANIFSSMSVACSEFGVFLSSHDLEFLSIINHIFDCPPIHIEDRRTSGRTEITKPNLIILAGTQPDFLGSVLPDEAWGMGFTSRLLMIYAPSAPTTDLFANQEANNVEFVQKLKEIFSYQGEFVWSKNAIEEINKWNSEGCPPVPVHSRLTHYLGRRAIYAMKLSMISCASRDASMNVKIEDFERAKDWLLTAEVTMPDIFRAMGQKSDAQIIMDLHFHLWRLYSSVAIDRREALPERVIYKYLYDRTPSEKIPKLIEVANKAGYLEKGKYPGEWVPRPLAEVAKL